MSTATPDFDTSKAAAPSPKDISLSPLGAPIRVSAQVTSTLLADPASTASRAARKAFVPALSEPAKSMV